MKILTHPLLPYILYGVIIIAGLIIFYRLLLKLRRKIEYRMDLMEIESFDSGYPEFYALFKSFSQLKKGDKSKSLKKELKITLEKIFLSKMKQTLGMSGKDIEKMLTLAKEEGGKELYTIVYNSIQKVIVEYASDNIHTMRKVAAVYVKSINCRQNTTVELIKSVMIGNPYIKQLVGSNGINGEQMFLNQVSDIVRQN